VRAEAAGAPLVAARGIVKSYGGVRALRGVDFDVRAGEVHALVGENGAGKSSLVKVLSGIVQPDAGTIERGGAAVAIDKPARAKALGIETMHQELELALPLSVAENVFLGILPAGRWGMVRRQALRERTRAVLQLLGAEFAPETPVERLRIADRQVVEIARAIVRDARVLIMDEPTAALPPVEVGKLMERIRALRAQGVGVVYVSHRLDEVLDISDRISVMRDGTKVVELKRGEADRAALVSHILGRELATLSLAKREASGAGDVIACRDLSAPPLLQRASFAVARGELVGFFGLLGAGQSAIAEALFGVRPDARAAQCRIGDHASLPRTPREAIALGIGYVPADRKNEGLALNLSIVENLMLPSWQQVTRRDGFVRRAQARAIAESVAQRYDLRYAHLGQEAGELSGGNQQKVVLGKWSATGSRILLLDEPTRGVDVGAKAEIYRLLKAFAAEGGTGLVFSSDAEEMCTLCDRVYVLRRGAIAAEVAGSELSDTALVRAAL
jgi:ABC-type sugar transport system ATPase subunit